jgi:hypothetical protein
MLKGLRGILEKGLQIAAPIIGNMILPGAGGAMLGSGIASLISGQKPKDALIAAGIAGLGAGKFFGPENAKTSLIDKAGKQFTSERTPIFGKDGIISKVTQSPIFTPRTNEAGDIVGPSIGGQILSAGLPAVLSYLAAEQDRKRAFVPDAREYQSAVDVAYGGQLAPPTADRRVQNLFPVAAAQGGMMEEEKTNGLANLGDRISYSATTGGIMGMADGGDVENFPRRTGEISGPGTKTSDSIPAMLSDGEFVQRADAVNGAGVMMGAKNADEAREKGADFMYALQSKLAKMGKKVG